MTVYKWSLFSYFREYLLHLAKIYLKLASLWYDVAVSSRIDMFFSSIQRRSDIKMKKKENKEFSIICKEANLFKQSEISEDYKNIVSAMSYHNGLPKMTNNDFKKLPSHIQSYLISEWNKIFNIAQSEWIATQYEAKSDGKMIDCELCGHKNIGSLFKIKNIKNQKELIVGSECIKFFDGIINNSKEDRKIRMKQQREKRKEQVNIEYAESISIGISSKVKNFKRIVDDHSFIMSAKLKNEYERISKLIKEDYDIELRKSQSKIDKRKIIGTNSQITAFENELEEFKKKYKNDKWQITEGIARWCYINGDKELIERLMVNEKIDISTADQIKENNYLHSVVEEFKDFLKFNHFKLIKNNSYNFNVVSDYNGTIIIIVDTIEFLKKYKKNLFEDNYEIFKIKDLLSVSKINKENYDICADLITRKCKHEYKYRIQNANINEIAFTSNKCVLVLDYAKFIDRFKNYIFKKNLEPKMNDAVIKYIEEESKKYNFDEYSLHLKRLGI